MDLLQNLGIGFGVAFTVTNLLYRLLRLRAPAR
jgi:hypothetical protein